MADEHDDLLNFDIGDGDFADGTLNEDELLLSDEENFDDHKEISRKHVAPPQPALPKVEPRKDINKELTTKNEKKVEKFDEDEFYEDDLLEPEPKKKAVEVKSKTPEVKNQVLESKTQVLEIKLQVPESKQPTTELKNQIQPESKQQVPEQKPQASNLDPKPIQQVPEPEEQVRESKSQILESKVEKLEVPEPKRKTPEPDHDLQFPDPQEEPLDYEEQQSQPESDQQHEDEQMPEPAGPLEPSELPAPQNDHQSDPQDGNQYPHPPHHPHQQFPMGPRQFRPQKFGPRGMPRWMNPSGPPAPVPFPQQQRPLRPPQMGPLRPPLNGPPQMRPGGPFPPQRAPFYMQSRPGAPNRPPGPPGNRFFFQNQQGSGPAPPQSPAYVPTPIAPNVPIMPRKVLINPNFKGGIEAVKTQLLKEHFSQSSSMSEEELLRKQQEFINSNMRSIEKRRHERSPSPNYRRSYSHSPSPPRAYRRRPFRPYERRRSMGDRDGNKAKEKDENLPEEDEETRAYRLKIETQRKQREELLKQKELRRKQQMEAKAKETEPLKPIVVTEKKIILTKKPRLDEKSTTPPIDDAPLPATLTTQRRIVLKSAKDLKSGVADAKIGIAGNDKKKLQKIIKAEN